MVAPTTSYPCSTRRAAATELSTPPDIATSTRAVIGRSVGRPVCPSTPEPWTILLLRLTAGPPVRLSARHHVPALPRASAPSPPPQAQPPRRAPRRPCCSPGRS